MSFYCNVVFVAYFTYFIVNFFFLLFRFSPTLGFVCRNDDQIGDRCHDYKVRFGCACDCNGTIL